MKKVKYLVLPGIFAAAIFLAACVKNSPLALAEAKGALALSLTLLQPAQGTLAKSVQTVCNRLIIQVDALDMDTLRDTLTLSSGQTSLAYTLEGIAPGKNRRVSVWTINSTNGLVIHAPVNRAFDVNSSATASVNLTLSPSRGSIYLSFHDIDPLVDTVKVLFAAGADTFSARGAVASGSRILLNLDYVPNALSGTLFVYGIRDSLSFFDTLYRFSRSFVFRANADSTLRADFTVTPGKLAFNVGLAIPGVTLIEGAMNSGALADTVENGTLYITEINYSAEDSEYVEIFNPLDADAVFDTLILEVNSEYRRFVNVRVSAKGFFVFGRKALSYANVWPAASSALDLSSTYESLALRTKDLALLDAVSFTGSSNQQEWPVLGASAKTAIVLDSLGGATYNNYGRHWKPATSVMAGTGLKGTPGCF